MDIEYIADHAADRIRDYILYDKQGNHNEPKEVARRYEVIRKKMGGLFGMDELEIAEG